MTYDPAAHSSTPDRFLRLSHWRQDTDAIDVRRDGEVEKTAMGDGGGRGRMVRTSKSPRSRLSL